MRPRVDLMRICEWTSLSELHYAQGECACLVRQERRRKRLFKHLVSASGHAATHTLAPLRCATLSARPARAPIAQRAHHAHGEGLNLITHTPLGATVAAFGS